MSDTAIIITTKPQPRVPTSIRQGTMADMPFIDALQKMHSHMVGFFQGKQMEQYIEGGNVLIAEEGKSKGAKDQNPNQENSPFGLCQFDPLDFVRPVGYVIAKDQYLKRDDVGIIYQLNVMPLRHRHLVGASLVKAA